ncbi:MAG: radical SAM family heme chaperone HemW, partial [Planctomycetota bacterium]
MINDHAQSFTLPQIRGDLGGTSENTTLEGLLTSLRATGSLYANAGYVHIPFCFHKCHYCDFYSIVDNLDREEAFVRRMMSEIEVVGPNILRGLSSIFVGGGTPTLMTVDSWSRLLPVIREHLPLAPDGEWTMEANPETMTDELAACLVAGGVNRISVGAQSFDPRHLKTLERWHDPVNVGRAVTAFRDAGIGSINVDLIFGIPGQTLNDWHRDLDRVLELKPDHLSCYALTYEPNTAMTARMNAGRFEPIDEDIEADMFLATMERLRGAGFEHYEISNWARPGHACRH